jgi:hypothetical protein
LDLRHSGHHEKSFWVAKDAEPDKIAVMHQQPRINLAPLFFVLLLAGCSGSSAVSDAKLVDAPPNATPDGATTPLTVSCAAPTATDGEICTGTVDPTLLDAGIEVVLSGTTPAAPGQHWFCRPGNGVTWNGRVLLHLVGTYSDPAGDFRFAERACAQGYAAIEPMYKNRDSVRSTCANDPACYETFHQEIIYGTPVAAAPIDVNAANSLLSRARSLATRLITGDAAFTGWSAIATSLKGNDWSKVALSGHSQGSGHALFLARDFNAERLIILAGPADRLNDGQPNHAAVPWITAMATTPPKTPIANFYTFIHADDGIEVVAQVEGNWDSMGISANRCVFANGGGYPAACRRVFISADGCSDINAHTTVISRLWGANCALGAAATNLSRATWKFLLGNGLQ